MSCSKKGERRWAAALVLAAVGSVVTAGQPLRAQQLDDRKVTITGCVVKGDGDGDGFLLANSVERTTRTVTTPDPAGPTVATSTSTALGPTRILYWLDDDDDVLDKHMGQLVEVVGEIEGDVRRGEIEIERENGMIELEIKGADRKATVRLPDVPSAVGTSGSVRDREVELNYVVRKLDVKSARAIGAGCQ